MNQTASVGRLPTANWGMHMTMTNMPNGPIANFDQAIPNFVSKHVRKYCDDLARNSFVSAPKRKQHTRMSGQQDKPGDKEAQNQESSRSDWRTSGAAQGPQMQPGVLEGFAAVVMVDVSGYSKLSSTLAERGPIGAEILGKTMKDYLDKIIHIILLHGGDIVKFVGDAVIFYWKIPGTVDTSGSEKDLARGEIVLKACNCCLDLLTQLGTYNIDIPDCSTKELRIHLGIGAGKIYDIHVGGSPGRWEHFVAGDAVSQLSQVLDLAKAGELAVSHQALKWFGCVMDIDTVNIGDYDKRCILLSGLEAARRKVPPPTPTDHDELDLWEIQTGTLNIELYKKFINHSAIFKLQADINQSKLFRLESSLADLMSLYELRQVSTLFIRVGSLSKWEGAEFIEEAQDAISVVQTALQKYEGSLRQFNVDDKGASILAFFGLPPLAHENDAIYCIKAGLEVKDKFRDLFDHFSIGITTGVVSIGGVGNSIRTEYAVMGDSINMAARLMMHHEAQESILCDEKSYNLCDRDFVFEKLGRTKVKGKAKPISIFRPKAVSTEDSQARRANIETNSSGNLVMFGRHNEREAIIKALETQTRADTSKILTFQADGGQGLSTLVKFTQIEAIRHGCCPCVGSASEMERSTPYYVFRDIVCDLFAYIDAAIVSDLGVLKIRTVKDTDGNDSIAASAERLRQALSTEALEKPGAPERQQSVKEPAMVNKRSSSSATWERLVKKSSSSHIFSHGNSLEQQPSVHNIAEATKNITGALKEQLAIGATGSTTARDQSSRMPTEAVKKANSIEMEISGNKLKEKYLNAIAGSDSIALARRRRASVIGVGPSETRKGMANETFFEEKVKQGLTKLNENPQYSALFDLIMPFDFQDTEVVSQLQGKIRMKELVELLKRVINAVSENNALVLVFHETHWVDTLSWELIVDIINCCPKTMVCIFSRSERYYESEDTRNIFIKTKRMSRCQAFSIEGMSLDETKQLIISTWLSSSMREVSQQLAENIFKRTSGNPLFIRSLVVALKESGQWRISDSGELQTGDFDFDQVVLGSDLQSIIVAQFDRLDRNFQLFLKVASVLGQRFLLDDVLFFLVDMTGFSDKFDRRNVAQITRHIDMVDKYGYLQRVEGDQDGLFFQFKSAVVRKGIYNMMVMSQRQQLHLNVAIYYEKVLNESNKHRLLIPLYEHYIETDENQNRKKIKYLEKVAHFYYEKQSVAEAIKHYSLLLETVEVLYNKGVILFDRFKVAVWHREIGESYFSRMDYTKAEIHLLESIKLVDHPFPEGKFKLDWEIRKQRSHRVRFSVGGTGDSFKNLRSDDAGSSLLLTPPLLQGVTINAIQAPSVSYLSQGNGTAGATGMELDLLRTWTTGKSNSAINGTGQGQNQSQTPGTLHPHPRVVSQINSAGEVRDIRAQSIAQIPGTLGHHHQGAAGQVQPGVEDERQDLEACLQDKAMAVLHHVRLTLLTLSQLYLILENPKRHKYAVIMGLNISERFPKGSLYAKYLALAGSAFWLMDRRKVAAIRYLEAADRYDRRIDLTATASVVSCQSQTLFLLGAWEAAFSRYELLSQLSVVTGEFPVREEALRMKALIIFQKGTRSQSLSVSRHLYSLASQEDHWLGKFWGSFFVICNLLGSSNSVGELQDMTKTIKCLWSHEHGERHIENPALITAYQSILSESEFRLGFGLNLNKLLQELESAATRLNPHHWIAIFPLIHLANTLFAANDTGSLANPAQRQLAVRFCLILERSLKRMDILCANEIVRYMFKGFRLVCAGSSAQGVLSWRAKQKAVRQWQKALALPIANELSYIKALLNFRIGRYSERGSSEASETLSEAQKEFRKLGAFYELERASAML